MSFSSSYQLGNCVVLPLQHAITFNDGEKKSLQPKFVEVLNYLAANYPRVIPREELIENIWQGNSYVGEKALTNAIWHLRQTLKQANDLDVIETIRKVGYRLVVEPQILTKRFTDDLPETNSGSINNELGASQEKQASLTSPANFEKLISDKPSITLSLTLLLALIIFGLSYSVDNHDQFAPPKIIKITKYPGSELFAAPSPDGRYVVFKWQKTDGSHNLYLRDNHQPSLAAKQLTFDENKQGISVWGINGKYLYFTKKSSNNCQLVRLDVAKSQEKTITNCPKSGGYYYLDISPDNKILAFHGRESGISDPGIYFLDLEKPNDKPVRFSCAKNCGYEDRDMAFSPDGKYLAVTRRTNRFSENIYLVDINTKHAVQLTENEEDIVGISWHPNSQLLVYATQRSDVRTGYILNVNDKHQHKLAIEGFSYPEFAKKSGELFYQQRKESYFIASLSLNTKVFSAPFPVIQSDYNHRYPDYSTINGKMVFVSNESGHYELWQADANGENREQLTQLKQSIRYPKWSNKGDRIAFLAPIDDEDGDRIYIYEIASRKLSIIESGFYKHNRPTWSYDDQQVISAVYTDEFVDLHAFAIEYSNATRLTFNGGRYGVMTSASTLLYTNASKGLWQKNLTNSKSSEKAKAKKIIDGSIFDSRYTWHFQDGGIYFTKNHDNHHEIAFYNLAQHSTTPIMHLPLRTFASQSSLSYIKSSNQLLFTKALYPQSDIKQLHHPLLRK